MAYTIRAMQKDDIPQVTEIDREAFATMWPPVNFNHEITNRLAYYNVACDGQKVLPPAKPAIKLVPVHSFLGIKWPFSPKMQETDPLPATTDIIIGFVGVWMMVDEAHIVNIAVRSNLRGQGIGELLLISSIDMAEKLNAQFLTLEVRRSNTVAQSLYSKYGFNEVGLRKGYYTDNKEDALIMTTDLIATDGFKQSFSALKEKHLKKLKNLKYSIDVTKGK